MELLNYYKSGQKGFSLIELMVAISVIGIMLSIAIPVYHQHMVKARLEKIWQPLFMVSKHALIQYDERGGTFTGVTGPVSGPNIGAGSYNTSASGGTALQINANISDPEYPEIDGKWIYVILTGQGTGAGATVAICCGLKTAQYGSSTSPSVSLLPSGCNNNCYFPW